MVYSKQILTEVLQSYGIDYEEFQSKCKKLKVKKQKLEEIKKIGDSAMFRSYVERSFNETEYRYINTHENKLGFEVYHFPRTEKISNLLKKFIFEEGRTVDSNLIIRNNKNQNDYVIWKKYNYYDPASKSFVKKIGKHTITIPIEDLTFHCSYNYGCYDDDFEIIFRN